MDVEFVVSSISSIFNDNCWFTNYHFHIQWRIQQLTEKNTNCLNPFSELLHSSLYTKMIISKSIVIIKYWRNTANYKIYIHFYLFKLPTCGYEGQKATPINVECEIQHSHISFLVLVFRAHHGRFPPNKGVYETHPSRNITTKFQYSSILKCMVHQLSYC